MDIVFAIDGSKDVDKEKFTKMHELVEASLKSFNISDQGVHVGVLVYSDKVENYLPLRKGTSADVVSLALRKLKKADGDIDFDTLLKHVNSDIFGSAGNARASVPKILNVFVGSQSKSDKKLNSPRLVNSLRAQGVEIIVVGVGSKPDQEELVNLAGNPENVMVIPKDDEIPTVIGELEEKFSQASGECCVMF